MLDDILAEDIPPVTVVAVSGKSTVRVVVRLEQFVHPFVKGHEILELHSRVVVELSRFRNSHCRVAEWSKFVSVRWTWSMSLTYYRDWLERGRLGSRLRTWNWLYRLYRFWRDYMLWRS